MYGKLLCILLNSPSMKKIIGLAVVILVIIGIVQLVQRDASAPENIRIGGAFALTGFASEWGNIELDAVTLAIEEINAEGGINGTSVELVVEDTASDNKQTASAVTKLIDVDGVVAVLGPTWLDTFGSATPLSDQYDTIILTPSASITAVQADTVHENVFDTFYRPDTQFQKLAHHAASRNIKRITAVYALDPYFSEAVENIKKGSEEKGVEFLESFEVTDRETDFRTILTKIAQNKPDAIYFGFLSEKSLLSFLQQKQQLVPDVQLITGDFIEAFALKDEYNELLQGTEYVSALPLPEEFKDRFEKRFGREAAFSAGTAYDATKILVEAVANTDASTQAIRDYLHSKTFESITFGTLEFNELGGVKQSDSQINKVVGKKLETIVESI